MNDALLVLGYAAVVAGCWLVSPPLALVIGGSLLAVTGIVRHLNAGRSRGPT